MTSVRVVRAVVFKKCCMRSGNYDGSRRNYFFPRIEQQLRTGIAVHGDIRMFLRFVVAEIDKDSERALGVFHAVWTLRDAGHLHAYEEERHDMVRWWFNENLERPTRFTAAKAPFYRKKNRALSWFKDTAVEHLAYIRELVAILENHGVQVRTLKAKRVGYVVYEDEYQIVAEPFADINCWGGSELHGAKVKNTDDLDIYGVYLEPPELVLGLDKQDFYVWSTAGDERRNGPDDVDVCLYSLRKWAGLAAKGNPTALHFLFSRNYAPKPEPWVEVLKQWDVFLSRQASTQFRGFAEAQLRRLQGIGAGKKGQRHELTNRCSWVRHKSCNACHSVAE